MKIGLNARFLTHPYTGIGQYTRYLIEALAKVDHKNEYFLFTPELPSKETLIPWGGEWNLPDHFHQIRLPEKNMASKSLAKVHWEHTLLPQEMMKWKVDRAHFLYPSNPWRRLPFPTIVTMHDVIPWRLPAYRKRWRSKLYHFYARHALKKADHVITVSQFSKDEIRQVLKIPEKNITVIPHGLPLPSLEPPLPDLPLRRPFILYVGGYDERKNVPLLIQAYLKTVANHYPLDLILVGGKEKGLERWITDAFCERVANKFLVQPKGNVIFTPPLSNTELALLYKQALLFVHTSYYEGFNIPLVEAMSYGVPLVVADIPVNHEVTGGKAVFVDPHSIDSIGLGMHQLLNDSRMRAQLTQKGRAQAQNYNWQKSAQETLEVYNLFT